MNFLSWIVLILVLSAFGVVVWKLHCNKKRGCNGCSQGACGNCPMRGNCKGQNKASQRDTNDI